MAKKAPARHPSTAITPDIIEEITYRVFLRRLEPAMTPEESIATTRERDGRILADDAIRRKSSASLEPLTRVYLRVLVDMGLLGGVADV